MDNETRSNRRYRGCFGETRHQIDSLYQLSCIDKLWNDRGNRALRADLQREQFTEIHKNVLSEIGSRYGEKLAGYWFDSWYQSLAAYPDVPIEAAYRYCKVGNPCRITAFNFWIFPVLTPWAGLLGRRALRSSKSF
jgi:hypothetical protein